MKIGLQKKSTRIASFLLSAFLVCFLWPAEASADFEITGTCQVQADDGPAGTVKTLDYDYAHNTYLSLRDIAMILEDTDKCFSLAITRNSVSMMTGDTYTPVGVENTPWEDDGNPAVSLRRNAFTVNEQEVLYHTMILRLPSGDYDCYMMAADLGMLLDVDITVSDAGSMCIHTQEPFGVSMAALEEGGYFGGVNSVLAGDAISGEIYYRYQADTAYPIASTSKLMTYLLTMDAVMAGEITLEESVPVSETVEMLAASDDGVLPLKAGDEIAVEDLLIGLLLPSSNECALCLAEAVSGSEEAFVERMNEKAMELGLSQAVFYNSHGLPSYSQTPVPAKRQNSMSAEEMFRLSSYILKVYPQITDITSQKEAELKSLGLEVRNSNPLLYNLPEVTGLKTGTTNKAGACLVTSLTADDGVMEHDLIVVVLGAENSIERGRVSGLLARYALHRFHEKPGEPEAGASAQTVRSLPVHAEAAVECIIRYAKKR